jgi:hypothetical protein
MKNENNKFDGEKTGGVTGKTKMWGTHKTQRSKRDPSLGSG